MAFLGPKYTAAMKLNFAKKRARNLCNMSKHGCKQPY